MPRIPLPRWMTRCPPKLPKCRCPGVITRYIRGLQAYAGQRPSDEADGTATLLETGTARSDGRAPSAATPRTPKRRSFGGGYGQRSSGADADDDDGPTTVEAIGAIGAALFVSIKDVGVGVANAGRRVWLSVERCWKDRRLQMAEQKAANFEFHHRLLQWKSRALRAATTKRRMMSSLSRLVYRDQHRCLQSLRDYAKDVHKAKAKLRKAAGGFLHMEARRGFSTWQHFAADRKEKMLRIQTVLRRASPEGKAKLKAIGEPELMEEELMAGRLYTGPMVTPPLT